MAAAIQLIHLPLIEATVARAQASARRRANHNFHAGAGDNPHRFLNVLLRGSYAAPHRHREPPKSESFLVLQGELACWIFDDRGAVTERHVLGRGGVQGIEISPGVWHTIAAVSEVCVAYEVKPGPWDPATDKEFAPWAPAEGDAGVAAYLQGLLSDL